MAGLLVTVIADDLTGAADSAAPFAAAGLATWVFLDRAREEDEAAADRAVAAVDTDSRTKTVDDAVTLTHAAAAAAFRAGCRILYKKIDSTLRGHVGPEVAAVFAAAVESSTSGVRPIILMTPAFPATGRVVRSGRLWVDGAALDVSPSSLLAGAGLAVSSVASATEVGGAAALASAIAPLAGTAVDALVCDAVSEDDLRAIAEAGARLPRPVVWAGSGGLARHLPRALGLGSEVGSADGRAEAALAAASGPTLVLVGSRTAIARRQAAELARDAGVESMAVTPSTLLGGASDSSWREVAARLDRALGAGRDVAVVIAPEPSVTEGLEHDLAWAMGRLAASRAPIGALVATGGDTARAALRARGIEGYRLVGEIEPGVPIGIVPAAPGRAALRLVTKAGGFGDANTLVRSRASLRTSASGTRSFAT